MLRMRKIVLDLAVSLDGFIEGPNGEIDWCIMDEDMNFEGFLTSIDTIFYGRKSYDLWGNYKPEDHATTEEIHFWDTIHSKTKYVFSNQSLQDSRAIFISAPISEKVNKIKNQVGKDIWLYGGSHLIKDFIHLNLIDIYRISVHPIVLGSGKPLFEDIKERLELKLTTTNTFRSGVVQLIYESIK